MRSVKKKDWLSVDLGREDSSKFWKAADVEGDLGGYTRGRFVLT